MKRIKEALKEIDDNSISPNSYCIKEGSGARKQPVKEDSDESDNTTIVNSTSSPRSKSPDQLQEKDIHVPGKDLTATEAFDCQASKSVEGLDSLIGTLRHQIRSSDWLEKNTPELSAGEDPEILDVFKALLQRARK